MEKQKTTRSNLYKQNKPIIHTAIIILTAFILAFATTRYVFISSTVVGGSMESTLSDGDQGIGLGHIFLGDIERFDIVTFNYDEDDIFVKRVIGLPNEKIHYSEGVLTIDDQVVEENFKVLNKQSTETINRQLGDDQYFLLGDNRSAGASYDSRGFGPISKSQIISRGFLIFKSCQEKDLNDECISRSYNWPYFAN